VNLIPLAALLIACLALATSIWVLVTVERLRRRRPTRQIQVAGNGSTQLQSGGTLIIPASISSTGEEQSIDLDPIPARPGPTTQAIRRIDQELPRTTGRRTAGRDQA
jgi:hypothetical protein